MKPEIFRGAVTVRRATITRGGTTRGYLVSWKTPIAQAIMLTGEAMSREFCERLAAGGSSLTILGDLLNEKRVLKSTSKAGAASWANLSPEERSARARKNAITRWKRVREAEKGAES